MTGEDEFVLYSEKFILRRDHTHTHTQKKKKSYERRDYKSVDDNIHFFIKICLVFIVHIMIQIT